MHEMVNKSRRKQEVKRYFDQISTINDFQNDQLVLLWNKPKIKRSLHTKFEALWIGPC